MALDMALDMVLDMVLDITRQHENHESLPAVLAVLSWPHSKILERILMRLTGKEIVLVWFVTVLEQSNLQRNAE